MTVAVKNAPDTGTAKLLDNLAVASGAGIVYVAAAMWVVFCALPSLWWNLWGHFQGWTNALIVPGASAWSVLGLLLLMLAAAVLLCWGGARLYHANARPGLRAGIVFGSVGLLLAAEITAGVGFLLERRTGVAAGAGIAITVALGAVLVAGLAVLYLRPGFDGWLAMVEEQGWFSTSSYKRTQGALVRKCTLVAILAIFACGVWALGTHHALSVGGSWLIAIPYTDGLAVQLLPHVQLTVPLLLIALGLWLGWRVVNFPVFADFLIATEAEMNKVSWTTRKRLVQDTIVVLVTVALLTAFLFVVDMAWAWGLTKVGVIQQAEAGSQTATPQEPSY